MGQTLDIARGDPSWRCGRCRKSVYSTRGKVDSSWDVDEQSQIWERIKKEQRSKARRAAEALESRSSFSSSSSSRMTSGNCSKSTVGRSLLNEKRKRDATEASGRASSSTTRAPTKNQRRRRHGVPIKPDITKVAASKEEGGGGVAKAGKWGSHVLFARAVKGVDPSGDDDGTTVQFRPTNMQEAREADLYIGGLGVYEAKTREEVKAIRGRPTRRDPPRSSASHQITEQEEQTNKGQGGELLQASKMQDEEDGAAGSQSGNRGGDGDSGGSGEDSGNDSDSDMGLGAFPPELGR